MRRTSKLYRQNQRLEPPYRTHPRYEDGRLRSHYRPLNPTSRAPFTAEALSPSRQRPLIVNERPPALPVAAQPIMVTNLSDSVSSPAVGSFRWALSRPRPSIIRFAVGGNLDLAGWLTITGDDCWIDGSTAPSPGISIRRHGISISDATNITVDYLRVRPGDGFASGAERDAAIGGGVDSIQVIGQTRITSDILIRHCSLQDSTDENGSTWSRTRRVRWQDCIFSDGYHVNQPGSVLWRYGFLSGADSTSFYGMYYWDWLSIERCLFTNLEARSPALTGGVTHVINCLISGILTGGDINSASVNLVNNSLYYYKNNPRVGGSTRMFFVNQPSTAPYIVERGVYVSGNYVAGSLVVDQRDIVGLSTGCDVDAPTSLFRSTAWPIWHELPNMDAAEAEQYVLTYVGASIYRDSRDVEEISQATTHMLSPQPYPGPCS